MHDLFGIKPSLRYLGHNDQSSSKPGKVFSIILIVSILTLTAWLSKEIWLRQNPKTSVSDLVFENPPANRFSPNNFPFGFGLENPTNFDVFVDESIYYPIMNVTRKERVLGSNGEFFYTYLHKRVKLEICTKEHFGISAEKFVSARLSNRYCIALEQEPDVVPMLQGVWESDVNYYVWLDILKCDNATRNNTCATKAEQEAMLNSGYIDINYADYVIDPENYDEPATVFRNAYFTNTGYNFHREVNIYLKKINIVSDVGFITSSYENKSVTIIESIRELNDPNSHKPQIISIQFQMSRNVKVYNRLYIKILDIVPQINGAFAGLFLLISIILKPFARIKFYESIINRCFDIRPEISLSTRKPKIRRTKKFTLAGKKPETEPIPSSNKLDEEKDASTLQVIPDQQKLKEKSNKEEKILPLINVFSHVQNQKDSTENSNSKKSNDKDDHILPHENEDATPRMSEIEIKVLNQSKKTDLPDSQAIKLPDTSFPKIKIDKHNQLAKVRADSSLHNEMDQILSDEQCSIEKIDIIIDEKPETEKVEIDNLSPRQESDLPKSSRNLLNPSKKSSQGLASLIIANVNNGTQAYERNPTYTLRPSVSRIESMNTIKKTEDDEENYESAFVNVGFFEFYFSSFYKSARLKEKLRILEEGINIVDNTLDVLTMMTTNKEVDQLKNILLTKSQMDFMNSLPLPILPSPDEAKLKDLLDDPVAKMLLFVPHKIEKVKEQRKKSVQIEKSLLKKLRNSSKKK